MPVFSNNLSSYRIVFHCCILSFGFIFLACHSTKSVMSNSSKPNMNFLEELLKTEPQNFKTLVDNKDSLRLQIIYTQIDRDSKNNPVFTTHTFNVNPATYFYPASTVKLPVALLGLERLNELKVDSLNKNSIMITDSSYQKQEIIFNNPNAFEGKPSIAQNIKEIFLVSDNDAFNRLYEFLGQEYINDRLHKKGYNEVEIIHRLNIPLTIDENRHTNAISFYDTTGNIIYQQPPKISSYNYAKRNDFIGKGYYKGGSLINEPFDFSTKNKIDLSSLHNILKSVIFPNAVLKSERFNLTADDYNLLYKYMSIKPKENRYPVYDTSIYHDAYVKFLLLGTGKEPLPDNIRIFNKMGDAYGFLTDAAYIVDFENKVEFMLSATILCNSDGIFNDDKYDYDSVGFPFMKNLGQLIYNFEKQRPKKYLPDLSMFRINYNKED